MSEYYAVIRSTDHLAHYGVRGMKWGVRKAIERGSDRALSRQYRKAEKKLAKLERNANLKTQANIVSQEKKRQTTSRRIGEAGLLLGAGHAAGSIVNAGRKAYNMAQKTGIGYATANLTPAIALGAAGVGSLVNKSIHKHRKHQAERRMTTAGHAKAVAERNEFKREMDKAFAGTKYGSKKKSGR